MFAWYFLPSPGSADWQWVLWAVEGNVVPHTGRKGSVGGRNVHLSALSLAVIAPFELPAFVGSQRFLLIRATLLGRQLGWGRKGQVLLLSVQPRSPNSQRSIFYFYHQTLSLELKALTMWIKVACSVLCVITKRIHVRTVWTNVHGIITWLQSRETAPHRWENILTSVAQFLRFLFLSCSPKNWVLSKCKIPLGSLGLGVMTIVVRLIR